MTMVMLMHRSWRHLDTQAVTMMQHETETHVNMGGSVACRAPAAKRTSWVAARGVLQVLLRLVILCNGVKAAKGPA
jgi:hypothetical protein